MHFKISAVAFAFFFMLTCLSSTGAGLTVTVQKEVRQSEDFCYDENEDCGPSHWPGACQLNTGRQSPIDIAMEEATDPASAPSRALKMQMYSTEQNGFQIVNTGHTIQLSLNSAATSDPRHVILSYGDFGDYFFQQVHFHWGAVADRGSEHTLDGSSTPMELHLVHYSAVYPNFNSALESGDPQSLAVVGVRVEATDTANEDFQSIINSLQNVSDASQVGIPVSITSSFNLARFMPTARDFFAYEGSLTTPPCLEQVQWIFLRDTIKLSQTQIAQFRTVHNSHNKLLSKNYRPIQPLAGRKVEFYRAIENLSGTGFPIASSSMLLLIVSSIVLQALKFS